MCRVARDLRAYNEPRILRVLIREFGSPLISQLTIIYIIYIRLINY